MDGELGQLYFGRDDAEMDIAEGGLLHAGFLRTAAYDAVRNSRKHLIIGRKGSGKSAICRTLIGPLQERFPLQEQILTPDAVLGVLFDIGFLGVHRNAGVIYRRRNEDRIEPDDDTFSIHPSFRHALRAELPTPALPSASPLTSHYVAHADNAGYDAEILPGLFRGTASARLSRSTSALVQQLWVALHESGLPSEIREDLAPKVERIIAMAGPLDVEGTVLRVMDAADFLDNLARGLEQSGFAGTEKARHFVRKVDEVSRRLLRQASGIEQS
jgi:hypothetical protein